MDIRLMKRIIIIISILFLIVVQADANYIMFVRNTAAGSSATDYTADGNCRGAWFMNGVDAGETDRSSNGENLTENGTIGDGTGVPTSYSGSSRSFPGTIGDTLSHADGGSTDFYGADQAISVCAWFYPSSFGNERTLVAKGRISDTESWRFYVENSPVSLRVSLSSDGTTTVTAAGASTFLAEEWQHGCFVYDDTDVRIYLNGSLDSNGASNPLSYTDGIANSSEPFYLGRSAAQYWSGEMDEVIIFNRALSSGEVSEIYTSGIDGTKGGND